MLLCFTFLGYLGRFLSGPVHHFFIFLLFFYMGLLIHEYYESVIVRLLNTKYIWVVVLFILGFLQFWLFSGSSKYLRNGLGMLFSVVFVLFVYILSYDCVKENKIMTFLDRNCMGLYLFHSDLITAVVSLIGTTVIPIFVWGISLICIPISYLLTELLRKLKLHFVIGESYSGK